MKKMIQKWSLLAVTVLAMVSCKNTIESAEVMTPRNEVNTDALHTHKNSILSRPIVMAMHYGWGAEGGSGAQLYRLPDYLDVVVAKEARHELLPWMQEDLSTTQRVKRTIVLNSIDLHTPDFTLAQEMNLKIKRQRNKMKKEWLALAEAPTEEQQVEQITAMTEALTNEYKSMALAKAKQDVEEQLKAIDAYGFDGTCIKLPQNFELITKEDALALLAKVTGKCGGDKKPYLAVETPFEEARAEVEKATWIVFDRAVMEPALANFTEDATTWSNNRFLPSANFIGKDKEKGFKDETHFSLDDLSRMESILYWQAPNKGGVAYYHTEQDASTIVETMPYGTLSSLIEKLRALNL